MDFIKDRSLLSRIVDPGAASLLGALAIICTLYLGALNGDATFAVWAEWPAWAAIAATCQWMVLRKKNSGFALIDLAQSTVSSTQGLETTVVAILIVAAQSIEIAIDQSNTRGVYVSI
jgi:hypothetical protein